MKGGPKNTLQHQREFYSAFYGEDICGAEETATEEELDEAIAECAMMIEYSIDRGDKEEISFWRKMLQENKVQRRKMLSA